MSSIMINDNVIDFVVQARRQPSATSLCSNPRLRPPTSDSSITSLLTPADSKPSFDPPNVVTNPDGSAVVTISGNLPLGFALQPASLTRSLAHKIRRNGLR